MKIGIAGHGVVGSAMARYFRAHANRELVIYDKFQPPYDTLAQKAALNVCDLVFVCVPTPAGLDGRSCDTSAVEECLEWIESPVCIRSTIVPGTVDRLSLRWGNRLSFSPEFLGESPDHPWPEEGQCGFLIVGGPAAVCELCATIAAYQCGPGAQPQFIRTTARAAELCKYMENCFLAAKVAFVNQFYDIAQSFDVDFAELRELWLADPRIGASHSRVTRERGFRGRCLPKDIAAMVAVMESRGGAPLLASILKYNTDVCEAADRRGALAAGIER